MPYVLIRHKVEDYKRWKPAFVAHGATRKAKFRTGAITAEGYGTRRRRTGRFAGAASCSDLRVGELEKQRPARSQQKDGLPIDRPDLPIGSE
jgi:hypothetical protein